MDKEILSVEEVKDILDTLVLKVRNKFDVKDFTTRECKECSLMLMKLFDDIEIPYIPIANNEILMPDLEHHFGIAGFKTDKGYITVLLDLTYIQFSLDTYPGIIVDKEFTKIKSPGEFISLENKNRLIDKGYITLTEENFNDYLNSFIMSYRKQHNIDEKLIYDKAYKILDKFNIHFTPKDYLNKEDVMF